MGNGVVSIPTVDWNDPQSIANAVAALRDGTILIARGNHERALMLLLAAVLELGTMVDKGVWMLQVQSVLDHGKQYFPTSNIH